MKEKHSKNKTFFFGYKGVAMRLADPPVDLQEEKFSKHRAVAHCMQDAMSFPTA